MKANELMVGDYVKFTNEYPEKELRGKVAVVVGIRGRIDVRTTDDNQYHESEHPAYFEPIPLTEEILVKNGWEKHPMPFITEWYGRIALCEQNGRYFYTSIELNYVHQLQHLLRLCEIDKSIEL